MRKYIDRDNILVPKDWAKSLHRDSYFTATDTTMALSLLDRLRLDILIWSEHPDWIGLEADARLWETNGEDNGPN